MARLHEYQGKEIDIPAVIRLGGNTEDRAVDILRSRAAHRDDEDSRRRAVFSSERQLKRGVDV